MLSVQTVTCIDKNMYSSLHSILILSWLWAHWHTICLAPRTELHVLKLQNRAKGWRHYSFNVTKSNYINVIPNYSYVTAVHIIT